jgi:hypothetical protein
MKLTGMELSIINVISLFVAIPAVVLTKIFTLGYNIVPNDRVERLSSWSLKGYFPDAEHDRQSNSSKADVEYGMLLY